MSSNIRVASQSDISRIIPLWNEFMLNHLEITPYLLAAETSQTAVQKDIGKRIADPDSQFFLSEFDNELAGFISCRVIEPNHIVHEKVGYITETIVKEPFKRIGIGTLLFLTAKEWMYGRGADIIEGRVAIKNKEAADFWYKMGFAPTFHQLSYRREA